ncbi:hypothetical protein ETH_00036780, partial [Eimeria tenella]
SAAEEESLSLVRTNASLLRDVERLRAETKSLNDKIKQIISENEAAPSDSSGSSSSGSSSSSSSSSSASQQRLLHARLEEASLLRAAAEDELRSCRLELLQRDVQLKETKRQIEQLLLRQQTEERQTEQLQQQLQLAAVKDQLLSRMPSLELAAAQLNAELKTAHETMQQQHSS